MVLQWRLFLDLQIARTLLQRVLMVTWFFGRYSELENWGCWCGFLHYGWDNSQKTNHCTLNEDETDSTLIEDHDLNDSLKEDKLSSYTCMGNHIHLKGFKIIMGKVWRCRSFSIKKHDEFFYRVFFGIDETVEFVVDSGPWNFKNLVLARPRTGNEIKGTENCLTREYFWLHLTCLPRYC